MSSSETTSPDITHPREDAASNEGVHVPTDVVEPTQEQTSASQPESKIFELSIFIPRPDFCPEVEIPRPILTDGTPDVNSSNIELHLPTQGQETIRELQQSVLESAEGWWMGSFGLRRISVDSNGKPLAIEQADSLKSRPVYGEFTELSTAFESDNYKELTVKRALEAVSLPYNELSARLHVIRTRDVLYSQAPGLLAGNASHLPAYDPSQLGIGGGTSVFSLVRGPLPRLDDSAPLPSTNPSAAATANQSKSKGKAKQVVANAVISSPPANLGNQGTTAGVEHLLGFQLDASSFGGLLNPRHGQPIDDGNHPPARYLRHFAISPWSPPPHNLRLRGHLMYLSVTTFEGETLQITSHTKGFYVNKCSTTCFDTNPRLAKVGAATSPSAHFQSLPALLCSISPAFKDHLTSTWKSALLPAFPDLFTSVGITNCIPAFPWLVPAPKAAPDGVRSQLAYLITGSASAETLAPARDWADEFGQTRELPKSNLSDRVLRERIWSRLQADFTSAATRGAIACSRGEVAPLNPHEAEGAWTYVYNNMLFSRAEDEIGAYAHLGGTEAARLIASKDVTGVKVVNELDLAEVFTMSTTMIDYHGKRWLAQGVLPGIFRQIEPEVKDDKAGSDANVKSKVNGVDTSSAEEVSKPDEAGDTHSIGESTSSEATVPPPLYDIVYGSSDIERPEAGLRSDEAFHKVAKKVAEQLSLAEHKIIDFNGKEHQFWVSADAHGIRGADGRFYMIDLHRLAPVDVNFLERELNGPILDGKTDIGTLDKAEIKDGDEADSNLETKYPHRLLLLRLEAVQAYRQHLFRLFALEEIEQQKTAAKKTEESKDEEATGEVVKVEKDGAQTNGATDQSESEDKKPYIVDSSKFHFSFNPDAFIDRKSQPWSLAREDEDASIKTVRDMSAFVRENLVTAFVRELADIKILPADGQRLTEAFHTRGINMRYLGRVAHMIQTNLPDLASQSLVSDEIIKAWQASLALIEQEMMFRGFKHIYNRLLRTTTEAEACFCVSHILNCLLSSGNPKVPVDDEGDSESTSEWRSLTRESLHTEIIAQVARRFRYALPKTYFSDVLIHTKAQVLREVCSRSGIQLVLKDYFVNSTASEREAAGTNGHHHSTDEEGSTGSPEPSTSNGASKKRKGGKKANGCAAHALATLDHLFSPDDVLNLLPVVKDPAVRSATADELFAEGRRAFSKNQNALGQELCADAISTYEQVFGAVHPEMAKHWHALAIQFHQFTQQAVFEISNLQDRINDCLNALPRAGSESARESIRERIRQLQQQTDVEQLKKDIDLYIELAATNLRQSVVVAERTLGLDHPDTVQHYFDLAVMELHLGNTEVGMKFARHALELWRIIYGPGIHPDASSALTQAATFIHSVAEGANDRKSPGLMELARELIASFYGRDSGKYAEANMILAHLWRISSPEKALEYANEASTLLTLRYGAENSEAKQATQLFENISKSIEMQHRVEEERTAQLAKRVGLDPKRAAALRSKILAPVSATSQRELAKENVPELPVKPTGTPVNYENIDDLVRYIQGSPAKPVKVQPTKTTRSRRRPKH